MKKILNSKALIATVMLVAGILLGWVFFATPERYDDIHAAEGQSVSTWTCSMHPSVRQPGPGKCPICGMDLIPVPDGGGGEESLDIKMSPTAIKLAGIQTQTVGQGAAIKEIRLNGKVQPDERSVWSQSAHIPGRIEDLRVNFTGDQVRKGEVIAQVYSPELVTAQQELLEASKIKDSQPALYQAARDKLKNWKLNDDQIDEMLSRGKPMDRFPLIADASGIVLKRNVSVGDYVSRGMIIYDLVDLSHVWVLFDVYESDTRWIKKGSRVEFTVQSLPGEKFGGTVSFIDPVIDPKTRVSTARVEVANGGQKLKPEMFVTGMVKAGLDGSSEIMVPKSAVLWTGERSIVYIRRDSDNEVFFQLREVVLGPSLGQSYVIKEGLAPGEEVVVNGAFAIDAAAQLAGKPSMMSPEGGQSATGHDHGGMAPASRNDEVMQGAREAMEVAISSKAREALVPLFNSYLSMKDALTEDKFEEAKRSSAAMQEALGKVNMSLFTGDSHNAWMNYSDQLKKALEHTPHHNNVSDFRVSFQRVSDVMILMAKSFKPLKTPLYIEFCPMADDNKGAYWLSAKEEIRNPYFGEAMLTCGEVTETVK